MATIYTVGHGARRAEALIAILKGAAVATLVDVRAYPVSRRLPQFSRERWQRSLEDHGIRYEWQGKALGGMRRAYADHMQTAEFQAAAEALARRDGSVCMMCAERNPDECHRSHIADWLVARGHRVVHLMDEGQQRQHPGKLL